MSRFWLVRLTVLGIACSASLAQAQDLDRGKSASQIFSSNCSTCHRGPQGLSKAGDVRATASFLLQHYTTSPESAGSIAAYLVSVGGDPRSARLRPPSAAPDSDPQRAAPAQGPEDDERRERAAPRETASAPAARTPARARKSEPATVSSDPAPVITSSDPVPLVQERVAVQTPAPQASSPATPARREAPPAAPPEAGSPSSVAVDSTADGKSVVNDPAAQTPPVHAAQGEEPAPAAPASVPAEQGKPSQEGFSSPLP